MRRHIGKFVLSPGLFLVFIGTAAAQAVRVGGPLVPGDARPPLYLNLAPLLAKPAATTPVGFSPAQIRTAYGFSSLSSSINGSGQTIAIVDAYGDAYLQSDVSTFNSYWGLPQFGGSGPTLTVATQTGTRATSSGWALETALDVEWAHAIAPNANILLVLAKNGSLSNLLAAVDYAAQHGAGVVSMSWGGSEFSGESSYDFHFSVSGVTFVASSGDSGEISNGTEWPAASPNVVSVGGTSLTLSSSGTIASEKAWSGSGGGISLYEAMPAFQSGWQPFTSNRERTVPDVSYVADPNTGVAVYSANYGGWVEVGGTSVGAPQWSALIALSNQTHASRLGPGNPAIYQAALGQGTTAYGTPVINASYFNDIASGNDGSTSDADDFSVSGYDFVTGVGSPVAAGLVLFLW